MNTPTLTAADVMSRLSDAIGGGKLEAALAQANAQMAEKAAQLNGDVAEQIAAAETTPAPIDGLSDPGNDTPAEWAEAQARAASMAAHPAGKGRTQFATGGTVPGDTIADEAARAVNGDRAEAYGAGPENSLPRTAKMWSAYLGREVDGRDVANLMMLLKIAREAHAPKRDNHVDVIGYGILAEQLPAA